MAQLFHRSANSISKISLAFAVIAAGGLLAPVHPRWSRIVGKLVDSHLEMRVYSICLLRGEQEGRNRCRATQPQRAAPVREQLVDTVARQALGGRIRHDLAMRVAKSPWLRVPNHRA